MTLHILLHKCKRKTLKKGITTKRGRYVYQFCTMSRDGEIKQLSLCVSIMMHACILLLPHSGVQNYTLNVKVVAMMAPFLHRVYYLFDKKITCRRK